MWKDRKKAQKKINKKIHMINKNILTDNLWRGRFYVHQTDANWERFEDGSGGCLTVWLEVRDKKTGLYRSFRFDNYDFDWKLWSAVNDFICQDSGVWKNINLVKADKTDWTKIKFTPTRRVW